MTVYVVLLFRVLIGVYGSSELAEAAIVRDIQESELNSWPHSMYDIYERIVQ